MADFTVRVELHGANADDYVLLHDKMQAKGYFKEIIHSDGKRYKLPMAEYITTKNKAASDICREVVNIASEVKKYPDVLVTKSETRAWSLSIT